MIYTAVGSLLSLVFFSELSLKLRQIKVLDNRLERRSLEQTSTVKKIRENKEIRSGGLWFFHIST